MKAKHKVLKIEPKAIGVWDMRMFKIWVQHGNTTTRLACQNRESWAWAEAYRNLTSNNSC